MKMLSISSGSFKDLMSYQRKKTKEKKGTLFWLICFGFLITLPLIAELVVLYLNRTDLSDVKHTFDPLGFSGPFRELVFGVGDPLGFSGPFRELVFGVG